MGLLNSKKGRVDEWVEGSGGLVRQTTNVRAERTSSCHAAAQRPNWLPDNCLNWTCFAVLVSFYLRLFPSN